MTGADVIDVAQDAIWVVIMVAGPIMLIALVVGLIVALFQALTQIQEMTLTFVPKIIETKNGSYVELHKPVDYKIENGELRKFGRTIPIIYKYGTFIERNEKKKEYNIESIEFNAQGCVVGCPEFIISIDKNKNGIFNAINYNWFDKDFSQDLEPNDIGVTAITSPNSGENLTASETVTVTINNFGGESQSNFDVSYEVNGNIVTETVAGPLAGDSQTSYTFTQTADLSAFGTYNFTAI